MITFAYRLTGSGWAVAELGDQKTKARVPASYLCDALGDFVLAVEGVFSAESTECLWEEEPGEVHWKFRRAGDRVVVRVGRSEDHVTFDGEDDLLHFGSQVDSALRRLLDEWGVEGYSKQWGHPSPAEAHQRLEKAIAAEQQRRRDTK